MEENVIIREARPEDAERIIAYIQGLSEEPNIDVSSEPGELDISLEYT